MTEAILAVIVLGFLLLIIASEMARREAIREGYHERTKRLALEVELAGLLERLEARELDVEGHKCRMAELAHERDELRREVFSKGRSGAGRKP